MLTRFPSRFFPPAFTAIFFLLHSSALAGDLKLLGVFALPTEAEIDGRQPGGLSSLGFNKKSGQIVAASDAYRRGGSVLWFFNVETPPAKKFRVLPEKFVVLDGPASDVEGLALAPKNRVFLAHDEANGGNLKPGISCFDRKSGKKIFSFVLPEIFESTAKSGLQKNRGLESLSLDPKGRALFAASESPLLQDTKKGSWAGPVRILNFDIKDQKKLPLQRVYVPDAESNYNTLVDMLALGEGRLLMLERTLVERNRPRRVRIRIYEVDFFEKGASPVEGVSSLLKTNYKPLTKKLVFDSEVAGLEQIDNVEGMGFGPEVDGKATILLVSDNNFRKDQKTEFLLFAINE
ncbi:MAG: esterase-like activity of phytase family protein [Chthoniobacterales bacterium]